MLHLRGQEELFVSTLFATQICRPALFKEYPMTPFPTAKPLSESISSHSNALLSFSLSFPPYQNL